MIRAALGLALCLALAGCGARREPPRLIIDGSVGSDFQALAEDTWAEFLAVFGPRGGCFGDVTLRATRTLDSRAGYDPETATVTVRVPATAALLQGALVHEWAHHIEYQCDAHQELRPAFLEAQGLPADTPWRPELPPSEVPVSMWPDIPSEQCAEAAIELVLGRRQIMTKVRVDAGALRVLADWAAND